MAPPVGRRRWTECPYPGHPRQSYVVYSWSVAVFRPTPDSLQCPLCLYRTPTIVFVSPPDFPEYPRYR